MIYSFIIIYLKKQFNLETGDVNDVADHGAAGGLASRAPAVGHGGVHVVPGEEDGVEDPVHRSEERSLRI